MPQVASHRATCHRAPRRRTLRAPGSDAERKPMDLFEAISSRRSVRKFQLDPVPRDVLQQIIATGIEAPTGCNKQYKQYVIVDDPEVMDRIRPLSQAIDGAPAAIVLLVEPKGTPYGEFWIQDASAAMQNMLLAAVALGYAACWVEGAIRKCEGELREILAVPENLRIWSLLPVGKPGQQPARPPKSDAPEVTHHNRYGDKS